jgi:hypothetical protein
MMMMTSRLSRAFRTRGRVAANEFLFKRARCVSAMVRGQNFIRRFAKSVLRFACTESAQEPYLMHLL